MGRRLAREAAMKIAFARLLGGGAEYAEVIEETDAISMEDSIFADSLAQGVVEHSDKLDACLRKLVRNWDVDRLPKLDLTILRIALYELMYCKDVPQGAVIDEAVRLAKRFCDDGASAYINGCLGSYVRGNYNACCNGDCASGDEHPSANEASYINKESDE